MQLCNEIKYHNRKLNIAIAKFTGIEPQKEPPDTKNSLTTPQFIVSVRRRSNHLHPRLDCKRLRSATSQKKRKARSQYRKYFKKSRKQQCKEASRISKTISKQRFEPDNYLFDAKTEMNLMFAASQNFNKTTFLILMALSCHLIVEFALIANRNFVPILINNLKDYVNFFVFSAGHLVRTRNLLKKYLPVGFSGYLDRSHLKQGRKCLQPLEWKGHDVILVDDNPNAIHLWSQTTHIPIKRWLGNEDESELNDLFQQLQKVGIVNSFSYYLILH